MPTDVDRELARIGSTLERVRQRTDGPVATRSRRRREVEVLGRLGRIAMADGAILVAAIVAGLILPSGIGFMGAMLVAALLIVTTLTFAALPVEGTPEVAQLGQVALKALPETTERWLNAQRPALPAPARTLVDGIGVRLETLAPQLARLDETTPAAHEVRKLVGEQLPELINGYARVPEPLRGVERNGLTPNDQLAQGLALIDEEIAEMTEQLAQGDIDSFESHGRFLQIKYRDEDGPA